MKEKKKPTGDPHSKGFGTFLACLRVCLYVFERERERERRAREGIQLLKTKIVGGLRAREREVGLPVNIRTLTQDI